MSDVEDFTLPHPLKGQSQFELLVMTRLNQFGEMLAQIHQLEGSKNPLVLRSSV